MKPCVNFNRPTAIVTQAAGPAGRTSSYMLAALALLLLLGTSARAADIKAGAALAAKHCAKCHGANGNGDGPALKKLHSTVSPQSWHNKVAMSKWSDKEIVDMIKLGGKANGYAPVMPKFQGKLTNPQIADLLAYIRSLAP